MQVSYTGGSRLTSIMPLNFTWPWLERRSVTAGQQSLNSHWSRALCSHPAIILLRFACRICQLLFGPCCRPITSTSAILYTWTWRPIQSAACRLILHAQLQIPRSPLLFWSCREHADDHDWVPIFMRCLLSRFYSIKKGRANYRIIIRS